MTCNFSRCGLGGSAVLEEGCKVTAFLPAGTGYRLGCVSSSSVGPFYSKLTGVHGKQELPSNTPQKASLPLALPPFPNPTIFFW